MSAPFVSADIGGTNARLAWVRACDDGRIEVLAQRRYLCAQHPSLRAILADFLGDAPGAPALALAIAGIVLLFTHELRDNPGESGPILLGIALTLIGMPSR